MQVSHDFMLREVAGERMLLPLQQTGLGKIKSYELTPEGALLWHLLERGADDEALCSAYRDVTGSGEDEAKEDIAALIGTLREIGALL